MKLKTYFTTSPFELYSPPSCTSPPPTLKSSLRSGVYRMPRCWSQRPSVGQTPSAGTCGPGGQGWFLTLEIKGVGKGCGQAGGSLSAGHKDTTSLTTLPTFIECLVYMYWGGRPQARCPHLRPTTSRGHQGISTGSNVQHSGPVLVLMAGVGWGWWRLEI